MKLVVCGCSWSSRDNTLPDTEFGALAAKHFDLEYTNLATVGASNFVIRNQIDYAINTLKADFIIVNWTTPCRTEWAKTDALYDFSKTIENFDYTINPTSPVNHSHPANPTKNPNFLFNSITTILDQESYSDWLENELHSRGLTVTEKQFLTMKNYFLHWYREDLDVAKQMHYVKSAIYDLEKSNTKYLMSLNTLLFMQASNSNLYDYEHLINPIPEEFNIQGIASMLRFHDIEIKGWTDYADNPGKDLTYHISPEAQHYYFNSLLKDRVSKILCIV